MFMELPPFKMFLHTFYMYLKGNFHEYYMKEAGKSLPVMLVSKKKPWILYRTVFSYLK